MSNFIEWYASLAPKDETALITWQKPKLANGELQYHADGAIKATWPAFYPSQKLKPEQAYYANTGSFILERMPNGPSASRANCEFVLALMLDDVGTKAKTPPLSPTWIMETSPGNFQWGYAFSEQPTKAAFSAAVKAMAAAGYTDPGAGNPVRNFRLPGSVNLKPGKEKFAATLVEFKPEREYTLDEICTALNVTPGPEEKDSYPTIKLPDSGDDDVAKWLSENGLIYVAINGSGWMGVHCPQAELHSDGNPEGRYMPSNRAFCCYHSACENLGSARFLEWVAGQGGPRHSPGLREELLQAVMARAVKQLTPTETFPDASAAVVAEVERREAGRVEKAGWFTKYGYVEAGDCYFDIDERREISRATFNALYRHVYCASVHAGTSGKPRRVEASVSFDEHRQDMGARVLAGLTYAPGESVLCARDGLAYGNRWRDARPTVQGGAGDVSPWLEHLERLVPEEFEREHLLTLMAFKLQNPSIKINHGVLFSGVPGCGKDSLFAPFLWSIGGRDLQNVALVRNEEVTSSWGYALESEVLVINELRQTEAKDRRALENQLKPLLAAPPDLLPVNKKFLAPYMAANRLLVIAFSNERVPIAIPGDDRRWFVIWTQAPRMAAAEAARLWAWYEAGGRARVAAWLRARDVSRFEHGATPPVTDAKRMLTEAGLSPVESYLVELMRGRQGEFSAGVVSAPWQELAGRLSAMAPAGARIAVPVLLHALAEAGWLDCGLCHAREFATKRHLYCAPEFAEVGKAELRRMSEASRAGGGGGVLRAVK